MPLALPKAALLDLDGTIIDPIEGPEACWKAVCAPAAPRLGLTTRQLYDAIDTIRLAYWDDPQRAFQFRMDLRAATRQIVVTALEGLGISRPDEAHRIADAFRDRRDRYALVPGAIPTLERLQAGDVRLALLTNGSSSVQRWKIERFALARLFDCILVEGELGFGKPDERIYKLALDTLDVPAAESWMVGDDLHWDIAVPQRLGIYAIWVTRNNMGSPQPDGVRPDRVIASIAELLG